MPRFVRVRELRARLGDVLIAVQRGDQVVLTRSGKPFAAIVPVYRKRIRHLILEGRGRLTLPESAFDFWDNEVDRIWDKL